MFHIFLLTKQITLSLQLIHELLHAITRYEEKIKLHYNNGISTPNRPDGLFQSIEQDPNSVNMKR